MQLTLSEVVYRGVASWQLPALPGLLVQVLALLGLAPELYTDLAGNLPLPRTAASPAAIRSG